MPEETTFNVDPNQPMPTAPPVAPVEPTAPAEPATAPQSPINIDTGLVEDQMPSTPPPVPTEMAPEPQPTSEPQLAPEPQPTSMEIPTSSLDQELEQKLSEAAPESTLPATPENKGKLYIMIGAGAILMLVVGFIIWKFFFNTVDSSQTSNELFELNNTLGSNESDTTTTNNETLSDNEKMAELDSIVSELETIYSEEEVYSDAKLETVDEGVTR